MNMLRSPQSRRRWFALAVLVALAVGSYQLLPNAWSAALVSLDRALTGVELRQQRIDGRSHAFATRPGAPVVLLLHGFAGEKSQWNAFIRKLPEQFGVIALDMPGFGQSSARVDDRMDIASQGERVIAFIKARALTRLHLVGSSMGGHVAAYLAGKEPALVASLTMVEPQGVVTAARTEFDTYFARTGKSPLIARTPEEFERVVDLVFINRPFIPTPVYKQLQRSAIENADFNQRVWDAVTQDAATLPRLLATVRAPTLLIWGDSQKVFDTSAIEALREVQPKLSSVIVPGTGHLVMMEQPAKSASATASFVMSVDSARR